MEDPFVELASAASLGPERIGRKAASLAELASLGLPVPPGFVLPVGVAAEADRHAGALLAAARRCGPGPFAVRSSAVAEDLPGASYAGLYESVLGVAPADVAVAVRRVVEAAADPRIGAYRASAAAVGGPDGGRPGIAVLVQQLVDASAAGVAFTADPLSGDRDTTVVTAVAGTGERLVGGEAVGEEWRVRGGQVLQRPSAGAEPVLTEADAVAVAAMAERIAAHAGTPQDVEWALDQRRALHLLQARPMTALPEAVDWTPPGPGLWMRNFRLGEWLGDAMTPLFATWLVPAIEQGFQEGMRETLGGLMPYRFATVNGWYYSAPVPTAAALARVARESRGRAAWILSGGVGLALTDPAAADRLVLARLVRAWWHGVLPGYRALVAAAEDELPGAPAERLPSIVDGLGGAAGRYLWSVSMVGGSAWKMESALVRFARRRLAAVPGVRDDPQLLLRGLGAGPAAPPPHAVLTLDWHEPTVGELGPAMGTDAAGEERHRDLAAARRRAELACRAALVDRPMLLRRFLELLRVTQRYAVLREQQVRDLTLAWPVLRAAVRRLGEHLAARGLLTDAGDVFFLTHAELRGAIAGDVHPLLAATSERRALWERQRRLPAPLALGAPPRLIGDPMTRLAAAARGSRQLPDGAVVGHPASSGRAAGPVRLVRGPADFAEFLAGDVLVAATTAPAYTPLFARAAAVVTDGGTLAAHASLIAREYGIPAVVGTGDATRRLRTGQRVLVDGGAGTVTVV